METQLRGRQVSDSRQRRVLWRFLTKRHWYSCHPFSISAAPDGRSLRITVRGLGDFAAAFRAAEDGRAEAIVVVSSRLMTFGRQQIIEFAARRGLPVVSGWGPWAQAGALLSYGPDLDASVRRAAALVARVLKGAYPANLPVEQPTKFDLVINLRTAAALGLTIPPSLRTQATYLIE